MRLLLEGMFMPAPSGVEFESAAKLLSAAEEGANVPSQVGNLVIPHLRFSPHLRKQEIAMKGDMLA